MATALPSPRFVSPAIRALFKRRLAEITGVLLGLGGLALLLALVSYHASDPSFDTAASGRVANLAGPSGALVADLLLQAFGLAGALPGIALLAWAWRIAAHRGLSYSGRRAIALLAAIPLCAAGFAALPLWLGAAAGWPVAAGPGGAIGQDLAKLVLAAGRPFGLVGRGCALLFAAALMLAITSAALGLSGAEWRWALAALKRVATGLWRFALGAAWFAGRVGAGLGRIAWPGWRSSVFRPVPPAGEAAMAEDRREPWLGLPPEPAAPNAAAKPRITPRRRANSSPQQESLPLPEAGWRFPPLSLLRVPPTRAAIGPSADALEANARLLESVLAEYSVQGRIVEIRPGPVVALYELEPAPGIRSARVVGLADDVARSLSVTAVRIATVPGRNVIGIEMPNARRETVYLSELLASEQWAAHSGRLVLALGKTIGGEPVLADLARMPHLLIAGTTGSGKSVGINAMILSLLYRLSPEDCRLILIDPKMLELSVYEGIPHLMAPVVTEPAKAVSALKWTVREMERRYRALSQLGVRNIAGYNERVSAARAKGEILTRRVQTGFDAETGRPVFEEQPLALELLPLIVVVIDEMADLMMVAGKEIEAAVQRLAQMARAAGIHVIMATQRPSVDVITGTIKANFPTRISFQVISKFDSRTILGEQGAEQLLGQGDMLYMVGGGRITRVHGPFVSDREVEEVVAFLRAQGEPAYVEEVTEPAEDEEDPLLPGLGGIGAGESERGFYEQAVALVLRERRASTSFVQRHLQIGYNRAARLIEQMEKEGIVGPPNHVGKREVLIRRAENA